MLGLGLSWSQSILTDWCSHLPFFNKHPPPIWHICRPSIGHIFWRFFWHIFGRSGISSGAFSGVLFDIFFWQAYLLAFYLLTRRATWTRGRPNRCALPNTAQGDFGKAQAEALWYAPGPGVALRQFQDAIMERSNTLR